MNFKYIFPIAAISFAMLSCDKQLDIIPKGQTTLDRTADVELLLNQIYNLEAFPYDDLGQVCGECIGFSLSIPETMASTNTLKYAYMAFDESVDRITLAQEDARYSAIYKYINYFNTVIDKLEDSEGLEERKPSLRAEARVLRAYFHWLAAVIYARQYDASQPQLGGIAYVTDIDNMSQKTKLPLTEVYRLILEDCSDNVISLLPDNSSDVCRPSKAFGYAVRGKVLMQMKRYGEALPYFRKALDINGTIDNREYIKETGEWKLERNGEYNILYVGAGPLVNPTMEIITKETDAKFEKGDYVYKYCQSSGWDLSYGKMYSGQDGYRMFMGWNANGNPYGVTSVRLYLCAAECLIRTGSIREGLELTDLVRKNHVENPSSYTLMFDMFHLNEKAAMKFVQQTKWIECLGSYENFFDMKRWNSEPDYKTSVSKDLSDYGIKNLSPTSPLWVMPFPANATRYNSTLIQNF